MDRKFVITALVYAIIGMCLGIVMAASKNHVQHVTHAHILLVGFVVSFIYGLCHKLWLDNSCPLLAKIQFWVHQLGIAAMAIGLFLLYGQLAPFDAIDPLLALSSIAVLAGMVLMAVLFVRAGKKP